MARKPITRRAYKASPIKDRLIEMIHTENLWGQRLKSDRDLAEDFGVSRRTVRSALSDIEAMRLIIRRRGAGTFVAESPPPTPGVEAPLRILIVLQNNPIENVVWSYYDEILQGVLNMAEKMDVECTVWNLNKPEEYAKSHSSKELAQFDGYMSLSNTSRVLLSGMIEMKRGPVILLDHSLRDLEVHGVVDSSFRSGREIARHLTNQGHRRIAFVNVQSARTHNPEKFAGYEAALLECGIALDAELVLDPVQSSSHAEFVGQIDAFVERVMGLASPPTAIMAFNDIRAMIVINALQKRGFAVGRDVAVAGFGDGAARNNLYNDLTSCRIYARKIGEEGLRVAMRREVSNVINTTIVPNRLMIRDSTRSDAIVPAVDMDAMEAYLAACNVSVI